MENLPQAEKGTSRDIAASKLGMKATLLCSRYVMKVCIKKQYGTFEKYLEDRWGFGRERGHRLMKSAEFMQIAEKIIPENVAKNTFFGNISEVILPKNEGQCRPLLEKLKHNGERMVVETGELPEESLNLHPSNYRYQHTQTYTFTISHNYLKSLLYLEI